MHFYLSGPMTGYENFNYDAFAAAAAIIRIHHEVTNPVEGSGGEQGLPYKDYMRRAIEQLLTVEAVALLPGWEDSNGCRIELEVAKALELPIYEYQETSSGRGYTLLKPPNLESETEPKKESILEEAQRLVHGARESSYGRPIDNWTRTANIWSALLGVEVSAEQAALCMVGVKIAREAHSPKRDNRVDAAGYLSVLERIIEDRKDGID